MVSHPEQDILDSAVEWALRSTAVNKANGCDGIPAELFKTLKDDAVKVLHSICQQTWKKIHEKGTSFKIDCFFLFSCPVMVFATPWTAARQAFLSLTISQFAQGHVHCIGDALLLLLLSRFSRVQLCATPWTAAHVAPPSLGFSRQKHWSGLPFPSPMHESEK